MKFLIRSFALVMVPLIANAGTLEVEVSNLTSGITFTPVLAAAHGTDVSLFRSGEAASPELQMMAEGGNISGLSGLVTAAGGMVVENPAGGLLAPGASTTFTIDSGDMTHLSVVTMMLPTNDAFIGLGSMAIPASGTHMVYLNAYDAGTEVNDEIINGAGAPGMPGIPVAPAGDGGMGASGVESAETNVVHIHPGNIGDMDPAGGVSDVDSSKHRWLNPVARVTITVME